MRHFAMMSAKKENLFALTVRWIEYQSNFLNIPLSRWKIYVPYTRCIPFLRRAFFTHDSAEECLPKIYSVSKNDSLPFERKLGWMLSFLTPVIPDIPLERRIMIAQDALLLWEQSLMYETSWHKLYEVQEEFFSQYECSTLHLLRYISELWPDFLKKKNPPRESVYEHFLDRFDELKDPTVLMGAQGTLPFTREMMKQLKKYPQGWILFPYAPNPSQTSQDSLSAFHPLYGFQKTLLDLNLNYDDIVIICDEYFKSSNIKKKSKKISSFPDAQDAFLASYHGNFLTVPIKNTLHYYTVTTPMEEAYQVAQCLITCYKKGKSALCATPDPVLAQGVSILLENEGIPIQWQGSLCLIHHTSAHFILCLWQCIEKKWSFFSASDFLKHNTWKGRYPGLFQWMCFLENRYFRGNPLPENLWEWLNRHGQHTPYPRIAERIIKSFHSFFSSLSSMINSLQRYSLELWLNTLNQALEGVLKDWLWKESGKKVKEALNELINNAFAYEALNAAEVGVLLNHLFQNYFLSSPEHLNDSCETLLYLCGPKEARLLAPSYDVCILTSLYEGGWPRGITTNSLLPSGLQEHLKFPPSSWQIGMAARNFLSCLNAPEIIFIRSKNSGDPSRFLLRLQGISSSPVLENFKNFPYFVPSCDKPRVLCSQIKPKILSVSDMVLLYNNPYGFYLKRILGIYPLAPLQKEAGTSLGILFHRLLEQWMRRCPGNVSFLESVLKFHLMQLIEEMLFPQYSNRMIRTQILRCFEGFFEYELESRKNFFTSFIEAKGRKEVNTAFGSVVLVAQADRIDYKREGGIIIDYKTGVLPKTIQDDGVSSQLWWLAWILKNNGFKGVPDTFPIQKVQWFHLSLSHGFQCISAKALEHLEDYIQNQWKTLEGYISGTLPYIPLETENFTDGISRRLEWKN
ncbi:putative protein [Holospora elegans E1]|uniref:PD-(D/E)XK endonuclease-like domain-containing protein n=1 Tax=Holospora elegans E1 TaxID=1427503 RepID=A0A023DYU4_9PROT|nr:PD-(D/E)XK nuclease family protein [Holospora elegans]GAJ46676.1 putative protein [Holospora elegans E1]